MKPFPGEFYRRGTRPGLPGVSETAGETEERAEGKTGGDIEGEEERNGESAG